MYSRSGGRSEKRECRGLSRAPSELDHIMRLYLVRHALCDGVGSILLGRQPGVSLNEDGREQAALLADRLREERLHAVYSSPLERAHETAEAIAAPHQLPVCIE